MQGAACPLAPAPLRKTVGQHGGVDRTTAGAADGSDIETRILEQAVEYTPAKSGIRAATLQTETQLFFSHHAPATNSQSTTRKLA